MSDEDEPLDDQLGEELNAAGMRGGSGVPV